MPQGVHYTTVQQDLTAGSFAAAAGAAVGATLLSEGCRTVREAPFREAGAGLGTGAAAAAGPSLTGASQAVFPFFKAAAILPKCSP